MDTNYLARINYFLVALPLAALLGLAPIFLVEGFFAAEAFLAGALTLPAFLAIFLGALEPTFPDPSFCCAFSFLTAALWATVMRSFSSAESLKQPEPFLPAAAPGTRTPSSRIFFSTLFRVPAF